MLRLDPPDDTVVPFWFVDAGIGGNHQDFAGARHSWVELISTGPGLRWDVSRHATFRLTWGVPLVRVGAVGPLLGPQFGVQTTF